jgi:hypothetical protein
MPASELTSLLNDAEDDPISNESAPTAHRHSIREKYIIPSLIILIIVVDFSATCMSTAVFRAEELISCREYYRQVDPSLIDSNGFVLESYCKVDHVQKRLASIVGLEAFLAAIPGSWLKGHVNFYACILLSPEADLDPSQEYLFLYPSAGWLIERGESWFL